MATTETEKKSRLEGIAPWAPVVAALLEIVRGLLS